MRPVLMVAGRDPRDEISGGHSRYVVAHALAACRAGFEPHLFCVGATAVDEETEFGRIHRARALARPLRQQLIAVHGPLLLREVMRVARPLSPPHLIHGFGVWSWAAVRAAERLSEGGAPAVSVLSSYTTYAEEAKSQVAAIGTTYGRLMRPRYALGQFLKRLATRPYERRAYMGAQVVLYNYESVRRLIAATYGEKIRTRRTLYASPSAFGAAPSVADPPPPGLDVLMPRTAPLLVSVSRHQPRKGVDVFLRALARLRSGGLAFRAYLAGNGELLDEHRALVGRLGLASSVVVSGTIPSVAGLLAWADVFVLPSRREQSGSLALLEALQAGLPSVASACDGIPEDVVHGESAWLVPPGDDVALAEGLERLLGDADLRARLSRGARAIAAARFSADAFAADLRLAYEEALGLGMSGGDQVAAAAPTGR
ncbi:MAG: glycosyltransferase family 4 protein [Thermoanaerobaculia bacterium]